MSSGFETGELCREAYGAEECKEKCVTQSEIKDNLWAPKFNDGQNHKTAKHPARYCLRDAIFLQERNPLREDVAYKENDNTDDQRIGEVDLVFLHGRGFWRS